MTLIGPDVTPKYPTPWYHMDGFIFDADGKQIALTGSGGEMARLAVYAVNRVWGGLKEEISLNRSMSAFIGPRPRIVTPVYVLGFVEESNGFYIVDDEGKRVLGFGISEDNDPVARMVADALNEVFGTKDGELVCP